jgi:hypothetical protein
MKMLFGDCRPGIFIYLSVKVCFGSFCSALRRKPRAFDVYWNGSFSPINKVRDENAFWRLPPRYICIFIRESLFWFILFCPPPKTKGLWISQLIPDATVHRKSS